MTILCAGCGNSANIYRIVGSDIIKKHHWVCCFYINIRCGHNKSVALSFVYKEHMESKLKFWFIQTIK